MKVVTHLSLPDGSRLTVESPNIHGLLDMQRLGRLLEGEAATAVLARDFALPPNFGEANYGEFIAIAIDDAPLGWGPFATRVFVTRWPLKTQIFAGVVLEPRGGGWVSTVGVCNEISVKSAPAFLIREGWPTLLARLVEENLSGFISFCTAIRTPVDAHIAKELQSRCNFFNREGIDGFFEDPRHKNLWQIGVNWYDWEVRGLSGAERVVELNQFDTGITVDLETFLLVIQTAGLKIATHPIERRPEPRVRLEPPPQVELFSLLRNEAGDSQRRLSEFTEDEELETIFLGGIYPELGEDASLSAKEAALVRDWSPEADAIFSYGGSPKLSFDLDPKVEIPTGGNIEQVQLQELLDRVWWWKSIVNDFVGDTLKIVEGPAEKAAVQSASFVRWPENLLALFRDNWERSAFLYEFRARYGGRYAWPFGRPWVKLNNTERAILSIWWPVGHIGQDRIQPRLSPIVLQRMKSKVTVRIQHDLHSPAAVPQAQVLDGIKELAAKAGFKVPGRGQGRRQKLPWRALQYLDLEHFLGRTSPDSETKLKDAIKTYEAACEAVGLDP